MKQKQFVKESEQIGQQFKRFMNAKRQVTLTYANVESVDETNNTIDVTVTGNLPISGVQLALYADGEKSVICYPAVGSLIVLGLVEGNAQLSFVAQFSAIDKIVIRQNFDNTEDNITVEADTISVQRGNSTLKIENNAITLNGGENGGVINIAEITSAINNAFQTLQTWANTHTHPVSGSVAGATATPYTFTALNKDNYEDTKVTH